MAVLEKVEFLRVRKGSDARRGTESLLSAGGRVVSSEVDEQISTDVSQSYEVVLLDVPWTARMKEIQNLMTHAVFRGLRYQVDHVARKDNRDIRVRLTRRM